MLKTKLREAIMNLSGYLIYKRSDLPIGGFLSEDIKNHVKLNTVKTIFDVGANIGQFAKEISKIFPQATIISFEPVKESFDQLYLNTINNDKIKPFHLGLGSIEGNHAIRLHEPKDSVRNSLKEVNMGTDSTRMEIIVINTIDKFVQRNEFDEIDLLKIDTEGWEIEVLKGSEHLLNNQKVKMLYIECGFTPFDQVHTQLPELINYLAKYDYFLMNIYEISLSSFKNADHYGNALFVHRSLIK